MIRAALLLALLWSVPAAATSFRNPLNQSQCGWAGGCYVTAYYDLNRTSGTVRDWTCGTKTYDNHTGTDIGIGGFAGMDQNREVLAAADGVVTGAHDGEYDRCTTGSCGASNYVWLKHADGKVSLYYHLKKNTVAVSVGQTVTCGQKLGLVGSSGNSTGPHLHFQVNVSGSHDDPFAASSGCGGSISYWVSQGGYRALPGYACEAKPLPDVTVTELKLSPASPKAGDAVEFTAVVKNGGAASTGQIVGVGFFVDGAGVTWGTQPALAPGASATITSVAKWTAVAGKHAIEAFADDVNRFAESNENNNKRALEVTVAALPELVIGSLELEPSSPVEGDEVGLTAVIENRGGPAGSGFALAFELAGATLTGAGPALKAGESAAVTASIPWTAVRGTHELRAVLDTASAVAESDETNNTLTRPITVLAKDADGDGARADLDCDDSDAAVHPGAAEACNGRDDDCDGVEDQGLACGTENPDPEPEPVAPAADAPADDDDAGTALVTGGCGCASGGSAPLTLFGALALLAISRRQKRHTARPPPMV